MTFVLDSVCGLWMLLGSVEGILLSLGQCVNIAVYTSCIVSNGQ